MLHRRQSSDLAPVLGRLSCRAGGSGGGRLAQRQPAQRLAPAAVSVGRTSPNASEDRRAVVTTKRTAITVATTRAARSAGTVSATTSDRRMIQPKSVFEESDQDSDQDSDDNQFPRASAPLRLVPSAAAESRDRPQRRPQAGSRAGSGGETLASPSASRTESSKASSKGDRKSSSSTSSSSSSSSSARVASRSRGSARSQVGAGTGGKQAAASSAGRKPKSIFDDSDSDD